MLTLTDIHAFYGDAHVLHGVSLDVQPGEAVCVMGPNGAGKSTLLKVVAGAMHARAGSFTWFGKDARERSLKSSVEAGIMLVPEGRQIFGSMTIRENLLLGAHTRRGRADIEADILRMYDLFPVLGEKRSHLGREMSGGQQQMLAIARGLMSRPTLLLLDEPSLGLAPILVAQLPHALRTMRELFDTTLLLVEQNASLALDIASRGVVLETGRVRFRGSADELRELVRREGLLSEAS